jgi:hypothetical protein
MYVMLAYHMLRNSCAHGLGSCSKVPGLLVLHTLRFINAMVAGRLLHLDTFLDSHLIAVEKAPGRGRQPIAVWVCNAALLATAACPRASVSVPPLPARSGHQQRHLRCQPHPVHVGSWPPAGAHRLPERLQHQLPHYCPPGSRSLGTRAPPFCLNNLQSPLSALDGCPGGSSLNPLHNRRLLGQPMGT